MFHLIKKYGWLLFSFASVFFVTPVFAYSYYTNDTNTEITYSNAGDYLGFTFSAPQSGKISTICMVYDPGTGNSANLNIFDKGNPVPYDNVGSSVNNTSGRGRYCHLLADLGTGVPGFNVISGHDYWVTLFNIPNGTKVYGSGSSDVVTSLGYSADFGSSFSSTTPLVSPAISLIYQNTADLISFTTTTSELPDFTGWAVDLALQTPPDNFINATVHWGLTPLASDFYDTKPVAGLWGNTDTDFSTFLIPKKRKIAPDTVIYAYAELSRGVQILATSSLWSFYVTAGTSTSYQSVTSTWRAEYQDLVKDPYYNLLTSTSSGYIFGCSDDLDSFAKAFCKIGTFLLTPNEKSIAEFELLKDEVARKPPFGYVSAYSSVISGVSTTTSTVNLALIELEDFTFFVLWRQFLSIILYMGLGFWLFNRLRFYKFD